MINKLLIILLVTIMLSGCTDARNHPGDHSAPKTITYSFPDVLPIDSANKMLGSYLNSIGYQNSDTGLCSVTFSAALLRKYLDGIDGSDSIAYVKIMLAHQLSYINAGNANQPAGVNSAALTLLIAGYTASGDYVFYPTNLVIDNGMLCPNNCPPGQAASALLPVQNPKR